MKKIILSMICLLVVIAMISCGGASSSQMTYGETISSGRDSLNQMTDEQILSDYDSDALNKLTDREILVKIYEALNGPEWNGYKLENWLTDMPIEEWGGVKINNEGRVIELDIRGQNLRGLIPAEIGGLSELEKLTINMVDLGFDNVVPPEIGRLVKLKYLSLSADNTPTPDNTILPNISTLKNLEEFDVLGLGGGIPENIGQLRKLRKLHLWQFEGKIPEGICELTDLEELRLITSSQPVGAVPENIGRLSKLKLLEIDYKKWEKEIKQPNAKFPESVWDLTNLTNLKMGSLSSTGGPIPGDKVAKMTNLKEIIITNCGITGTIPVEFFALDEMSWIDLSKNQLTGKIPSEIGNCLNITYFDLDENQLSGSIPNEIGKCLNLDVLVLSQNQLTGNIPEELSKCKKLFWLKLWGNQLSPIIPESLKKNPDFNNFQIISKGN